MSENPLAGKRILLVTPEYPPENWGGLSRTVERVSLHCAAMEMETHVAHMRVVREHLPLFDENRRTWKKSVPVERSMVLVHEIKVGKEDYTDSNRDLWDCPHTLTMRMMYQSLEKLIETQRYDLLHSFFLYPMGYVSGLISRRFGIPHMTTLVGNDVKKYFFSPEKVGACARGLEKSDHVVALSEDLMDIADSLTEVRTKGTVVYNSVRLPDKQWRPKSRDGGLFKVGCAGIFKYAKGLPYLLKAVSMLNENRESVELELLGALRESERAVLDQMRGRAGMASIPKIKGPIPHDEINQWLLSLDAFVMPSISEGCPNILMEAMAAGLPCVSSNTGATAELIQDGISGILAPWGDSRAIAEAINLLMDNSEKAVKMGKEARRRMRLFSEERELEAWRNIYLNLLLVRR